MAPRLLLGGCPGPRHQPSPPVPFTWGKTRTHGFFPHRDPSQVECLLHAAWWEELGLVGAVTGHWGDDHPTALSEQH